MKAKEIIDFLKYSGINATFVGDPEIEVYSFSSIYKYKPKTITWARYDKTIDDVETSFFQCMILDKDASTDKEIGLQIIVMDPRATFFAVVDHFWGSKNENTISERAYIEDGAEIGNKVSIGPFTHISSETKIGNDSIIGSNVSIKGKVHIGERCIIQSGATIGENGFAFSKTDGKLIFVKHYGGVWIGNDVSIGANTCIVRGTIDDTIIGDMAKIDNLCHIAHNTEIGERVEIIASSTVMGSVHIGKDTWVATSMIRDQRQVGSNSVIGMGAVVVKDVPENTTVAGNPAKPFERKEKI